eukprot:scaffold54241_cov63-Phaeocystis_antarctica.AAC.4
MPGYWMLPSSFVASPGVVGREAKLASPCDWRNFGEVAIAADRSSRNSILAPLFRWNSSSSATEYLRSGRTSPRGLCFSSVISAFCWAARSMGMPATPTKTASIETTEGPLARKPKTCLFWYRSCLSFFSRRISRELQTRRGLGWCEPGGLGQIEREFGHAPSRTCG